MYLIFAYTATEVMLIQVIQICGSFFVPFQYVQRISNLYQVKPAEKCTAALILSFNIGHRDGARHFLAKAKNQKKQDSLLTNQQFRCNFALFLGKMAGKHNFIFKFVFQPSSNLRKFKFVGYVSHKIGRERVQTSHNT